MQDETTGSPDTPETQPSPPTPLPEGEGRQAGGADSKGESAAPATPEDALNKAREDANKYMANWQRAEADFQNYKRRTDQEREELRRFGNVSIIINLLPVLDDFERAFSSLDSHLAGLSWFDGIYLIYRKLSQLLENAGVRPIESEGQPFDPRFHEAVAHVEGEEGKVLSEVQRGYKLHDRVLRPAMVVVGKGKAEEEGSGKKEEGQDSDD
jgi:molecular chaperone GrpE